MSDADIMAEVRCMIAWYEERGLSWVNPVCFILLKHCGLLGMVIQPFSRYRKDRRSR